MVQGSLVTLIDDVLPDPDKAWEHAATRVYGTARGPDGLDYEGISFDVAPWVAHALYVRLHKMFGPVEPTYLFYRVSPAGARAPQWAHSDSKMGDETAVVYLTKTPPPGSGTVVLRHTETGLDRHPESPEEYATWRRDHSAYDRWTVVDYAPMKFNRMALLPGRTMHAALPPGGFGDGPWDARLVLVTFFRKLGD